MQDAAFPREMSPSTNVLIFGASRHIGGPAAEIITSQAPDVRLRLSTSREEEAAVLRGKFPNAEVIVANYLDIDSMIAATDGFDTMLVITPDFMDEQWAMTNLIAAVRRGGATPRHIVRITGDPPHVKSADQVSSELNAWGGGTAVQHLRARAVLEASGLPVTYVNIASYYMDNFVRMTLEAIQTMHTLFMPYDRRMNFIDARDVGAVAASLLLSRDAFHIGKTYHLDNGVDCLTFREVAAMMTEVFGRAIAYDDNVQNFREKCGPIFDRTYGPGVVEYMIAYSRWEQTADTIWRRTDLLSSLFGIKPRTLRKWLEDNKATFIG